MLLLAFSSLFYSMFFSIECINRMCKYDRTILGFSMRKEGKKKKKNIFLFSIISLIYTFWDNKPSAKCKKSEYQNCSAVMEHNAVDVL
jgi:hypothetical protein